MQVVRDCRDCCADRKWLDMKRSDMGAVAIDIVYSGAWWTVMMDGRKPVDHREGSRHGTLAVVRLVERTWSEVGTYTEG